MSSSPEGQQHAAERIGKVMLLAGLISFAVGGLMFALDNAVVGWLLLVVGVAELVASRVVPGMVAGQSTPEQRLADLNERFSTGAISAEDYQREHDRIVEGS